MLPRSFTLGFIGGDLFYRFNITCRLIKILLAEDGSESRTAAAGKNRGLKDEKVTVAIICRSYKFKKQALFNRAQQQRNICNSVTTIIQTPLTI